MPSLKSIVRKQTGLVDSWNAKNKIGQEVSVKLDSGERRETRTMSDEQLLGGHTAVVWLEGIAGAYALERVTAK